VTDPTIDDRSAIDGWQLRALIQMQLNPTAYVQRIVEQLGFLPTGGQHWERDIQIKIPTDPSVLPAEGQPSRTLHRPTLRPEAKDLFIVSLGMFTRSRFADFTVRNAQGTRLNLLTRLQHGYCLATALMFKYLSENQLSKLSDHQEQFSHLYEAAYELFTTVNRQSSTQNGARSPSEAIPKAREALIGLLRALGASEEEIQRKERRLKREFASLETVTQYLCWVVAEPAEVLNLSVSYTMADAPEIAPAALIPANSATNWEKWRISRTAAYASTGLGPFNYELRTPAHDHAGSYYFMIQPPDDSRVAYLDWGIDNSIDDHGGEVDCAYNSVHIHNGATLAERSEDQGHAATRSSIDGSQISAFLRAGVSGHWPLMVGALLTMLLAWLAQRGEFARDSASGISSALLIAPTALLAYVAQRQSHYYAKETRLLPRLIIGYLVLNIVFLISVSYDVWGGDSLYGRADFLDDLISGGTFIASLGLLGWFGVISLNDRFIEKGFAARDKEKDTVAAYSELGLRYGDRAAGGLVASALVLAVGMILFGWGSGRADFDQNRALTARHNNSATVNMRPASHIHSGHTPRITATGWQSKNR
jgi:hypothetical protein